MYNHQEIEQKWRAKWQEKNLYKTDDNSPKPKYYVLDMFPYPSGAGLHVGHPRGYIATDIIARYQLLNGFNTLHPMGWDAFGLPAENYALKNKIHPRQAIEQNIATYRRQLELFGFTYDWSREINTTDPEYYKWTQWAFIKMFERGLVYESNEPINWCPTCQTGLANEDVEDGRCERCDTPVVKKPLRQWVIKITDYAERLLNDLEKLSDWEEPIKEMQRNWIGRSEGAVIKFSIIPLSRGESAIKVFTTRPDTIFGATYLVICPEHDIIKNEELRIKNYEEVANYLEAIKNKSDLERTDLNKEKSGVQLQGIMAVNPATKEEIPIWVADYVLPNYGTGAIMAVPAHDERDFEFAKKYNLPIKTVIARTPSLSRGTRQSQDEIATPVSSTGLKAAVARDDKEDVFTGEGININSDFLNGLETAAAKEKIIKWLTEEKIGEPKIQYKLKDWVFSRQRYWGEPIPLIHCANCGVVAVPENELPLQLPEVENYEPTGTGESPLAKISDWVNVKCPHCGGDARRETNTMPQWAGSSWYYLAYIMKGMTKNNPFCHSESPSGGEESLQHTDKGEAISPSGRNDKKIILPLNNYKEVFDKWLPVDFYVGGAEHATRHLIYARFWHKFLQDIGVVAGDEPFIKYRHVGLILATDGKKMSKRWDNVINPDQVIADHGADAVRVYEMFMGPFGEPVVWSTNGLVGARKFLEKVYKLSCHCEEPRQPSGRRGNPMVIADKDEIAALPASWRIARNDIRNLLHKTIKKVGEDIEAFKFNTAISALMILVNKMSEAQEIAANDFKDFLKILAPFAPHLAEELWEKLGKTTSIFQAAWPTYDAKLAQDEIINLVVQVNGKVRATISAAADLSEIAAKELALGLPKITPWLKGKEVAQVIYVKGRLVNIVVK